MDMVSVAVCCSELQCVAGVCACSRRLSGAYPAIVDMVSVAVCCSELQCVAVSCSVLQ